MASKASCYKSINNIHIYIIASCIKVEKPIYIIEGSASFIFIPKSILTSCIFKNTQTSEMTASEWYIEWTSLCLKIAIYLHQFTFDTKWRVRLHAWGQSWHWDLQIYGEIMEYLIVIWRREVWNTVLSTTDITRIILYKWCGTFFNVEYLWFCSHFLYKQTYALHATFAW